MSELKDPDDSFDFNLQPDGLENDEYDDLNDETFGDCVQDWDVDQDKIDECIEEMKKIVGDSIPEIDLRIAASKFNNNPELALKSILSYQLTLNRNNLDDDELPKSIEQPINGQFKNNLIENDDDLIKNTLDRVSNHQFNQMHYQLIQQMQQQNQQMNNQLSPSLFLNQQQFNQQNLQPPHFIQFPQQFLPHLQTPVQNLNQFISQQNNLINNSLTSSNTLSDSFASMNLNSNFNQNGVNDPNLIANDLTNNLNSTFQTKLINEQHSQKNNFSEYLLNQQHNLLNGNESKPSKPRALTLEEIEQELLDNGTSNDITKQQANNKSLTLGVGEFVKLDKNASSSTTTELTSNNDRIQPKYMKQQQNFRNQNFNQNRQNNKNFRNYPSLIPNPLNPIEMIRNDNIKNNNGGNFNKYQNKQQYQQRNYQKNNYTHNLSYLNSRNPDDEYAGLMTPRDISWLRRIQQMQLEFDDPYVQDYYFVNYQTKKIAADVKKRDRLNGETDSSVPELLIPERGIHKLINNTINNDNNSTISSSTDQQSRYIPPDFSGSLGKIRVANVNYPRKLLDFENSDALTKNNDTIEPTGRKELNKFRRLLLDIERNLTMVLEIDHQNKKTAALPKDAQIPHLDERKRLCDELFNGILTTNDNKNVNFTIAKIRKGCMLIFKALQVLSEPEQKTIIISDLLKVDNFHHVVMQKDKTIYCLDYGQVLIDAIKTIKNCDFDYLLRIADGLDDASIIAKFQCGQEIIEVLINQYHFFYTINNDQKIKWKSFLERIKEDIEDISHLNKLCDDHLALF